MEKLFFLSVLALLLFDLMSMYGRSHSVRFRPSVGVPGGTEVAHKTATAFAAAHPDHVFCQLDGATRMAPSGAGARLIRLLRTCLSFRDCGACAMRVEKANPATCTGTRGSISGSTQMQGLIREMPSLLDSSPSVGRDLLRHSRPPYSASAEPAGVSALYSSGQHRFGPGGGSA